jgi:hypothetical protein
MLTYLVLMLEAMPKAQAEEPARPFVVTPYGFLRPGFSWRQDDEALLTDTDGFALQARFGVEAAAEPIRLRARMEVELQPEPILQDAFVNFTPHPVISLNVGQLKVPFSVSHLASDTRRQFPTANGVQRISEISRDIGLSVEGRVPIAGKPRLSLSSAVMNGEGKNRLENVNDDFLFAQRGLLLPFGPRELPGEGRSAAPYLGVGGGWVYNFTGSDASAVESNTIAAEVQFAVGVFSLQGEFIDREVEYATPEVRDHHAVAGYGQLGCFIPAPWLQEHLEIVARGGWSEPNDALAGTLDEVAGLDIDAGLNLYVPETPAYLHDVKLQLAYRHSIETEGESVDNDRFDALATVRF